MIRQIERVRKMHRRAVEVLYEDTCNIYVRKSEKDEKTKITAKKEVLVAENQPCRPMKPCPRQKITRGQQKKKWR